MKNQINQKLVNKINSLLEKGVTPGFSPNPKPGEMCLEQVVSYALGEEKITDKPSCVHPYVTNFVISLNDQRWSSSSARAEGMRELAIAQLGSNSLDKKEFGDKLIFAVITKLLPAMFRDLGEDKWKKEIESLEGAKDLKEARKAAYSAADSAAADAAYSAAYSASAVSAARATFDAYYAVDYIAYCAHAASYAADATKTGDKYLKMVAHLGVEVLKDMKSPGCQFI